jgi:hypothetical protein
MTCNPRNGSWFVLATLCSLAVVAMACGPRPTRVTTPTPPVASNPIPETPTAPAAVPPASGPPARGSSPPLTGMVTRTSIESFNDVWKRLRAEDYEPDAAAVATIRETSNGIEVFAVVATWCPDTRRDLPRFFKIVDRAGWSTEAMTFLAVDRSKRDPAGETVARNVTRVPTFIFLRGGQEIGRVVERPTTTLEQDIAQILQR